MFAAPINQGLAPSAQSSVATPKPGAPIPGATTTTPVTPPDQAVKDLILKNYPSYAWMLDIPDIVNVFKSALDPSTGNTTLMKSSEQLQSMIEATTWWKTHGTSVRDYLQMEKTDPDSLNEKVQAQDAYIHQLANKMGLADNQINIDQFARDSIMYGWGNAQIQEQLASRVMYNPAAPNTSSIGTVDNAMMAIKQTAASYMVNIDNQTAFNYAREIAAGHHTAEDYSAIFADQAKGRFPTLADVIDKGITPQQYFTPIQQEVGKMLEVPPDSIDLMNDPKYTKIVSYVDPKTNAPRPMTISEAQTYTRGLDAWKTTRNGQQAGADLSMAILKTFGKVG